MLLIKLRKERSEAAGLLGRMAGAGANLERVSSQLEAAASRAESVEGTLERLERRANAVESLEARLEAVQRDSAQLAQAGEGLRDRIETFGGSLSRIQKIVQDLEEGTRAARDLHRDLEGLADTTASLDQLATRADALGQRFQGLSQGFDTLRGEQDEAKQGQDQALQLAHETAALSTRLKEDVSQSAARIAQLEVTLGEVGRLQHLADRTQQDLKRLNGLSEHIIQKTRSLEQQREVVDRASAQTERLDSLVWDLDAGLKKVQQDSKQIRKLQASMLEVQDLSERVAAQEQQIRTLHQGKRDEEKELSTRYSRLRRQVEEGLERFALEHSAVSSVSQEMSDLRTGLGEFEARFQALEGAGRAIINAQSRADELESRLATLSADVARIDEQAEKVQSVEVGLKRLESAAAVLGEGMGRLEAREPSLRELGAQLTEVGGRLAEVREAHRWLQGLGEEIDQVRARHHESLSTLESVNGALRELDAKIATVQGMAGDVEVVRIDARRAVNAAEELAEREQFLGRLHDRVARLGAISTELDERFTSLEERRTVVVEMQARSESLQQRLDDADSRFERVAARADEVGEVEGRLVAATAGIEEAESRLGAIRGGIEKVEADDEMIRGIAERAERLAVELARREADLQAARTELTQVDALRRAAVQMAQEIDDQTRTNSEHLAGADARAGKVAALLQQLEERASGLRFTENRLSRFEQKLARLETAEEEIGRSIDALNERQRSIDAVRGDLGRIFETAERTLGEVRSITDSRQDISEAGAKLDETLRRMQEVDAMLTSLDERREKIGGAEQEAFRLEALLVDVQNSIETVRGQKSVVDLAVEKANQLAFQLKEAEVLLNALRDERELTARIHEAAGDARREKPRQAG